VKNYIDYLLIFNLFFKDLSNLSQETNPDEITEFKDEGSIGGYKEKHSQIEEGSDGGSTRISPSKSPRGMKSPIIYNKPTRCNSGSIVFINNYKYALHVSDALCVHHQEHYKPLTAATGVCHELVWNKSCVDVKVSHFGHGIVQCSPTLTSTQDLFQTNS